MSPVYQRIAIIGVGLIGASVAHAARETGAAGEIRLYDSDMQVRGRAVALGLGDVCADAESAVRDADLVVLATPVGAMRAAMEACRGALKPGATVTDVGSVKKAVAEAIAPLTPEGVFFVPGHPLAGTERSGPDAGFATLFQGRW